VEDRPVVTFIILFNVKKNKITQIAEQLAEIPEISEVYSVTGNYDLVAIVRTKTNDDVAELVTNRLGTIHGIKKTSMTWKRCFRSEWSGFQKLETLFKESMRRRLRERRHPRSGGSAAAGGSACSRAKLSSRNRFCRG
jgi:hypothetical protein